MASITSLQEVKNEKRSRKRLQKHNKALIGMNNGYIEIEKKVKKKGFTLIVRKVVNMFLPGVFASINISENMVLERGVEATTFFEKVGVQVEFI